MKRIAILASCDTKMAEAQFVAECIKACDCEPLVFDISCKNMIPDSCNRIMPSEILNYSGRNWDKMSAISKQDAIFWMQESLYLALKAYFSWQEIHGVIGMGGLQNTVMCSYAMQALPLGFPKLLVSTVASGNRLFRDIIGNHDIMILPAIVDFSGVNPISKGILRNAAQAVCGMAKEYIPIQWNQKTTVSTTLMGITNDTVVHAASLLMEQGYDVLSFHSTGSGGAVMEQLIRDGNISAVMDLTLHEMVPEFFGTPSFASGAQNRLTAGAEAGIPMVVCPGGIDFICQRKQELFDDYEKRGYVWHNKTLAHVRLYEEEILAICQIICERVNKANGPVTVLLPLKGLRTMSNPGEPFHIPSTMCKIKKLFSENLRPEIRFLPVDLNYDQPEFAELAAHEMEALLCQ